MPTAREASLRLSTGGDFHVARQLAQSILPMASRVLPSSSSGWKEMTPRVLASAGTDEHHPELNSRTVDGHGPWVGGDHGGVEATKIVAVPGLIECSPRREAPAFGAVEILLLARR